MSEWIPVNYEDLDQSQIYIFDGPWKDDKRLAWYEPENGHWWEAASVHSNYTLSDNSDLMMKLKYFKNSSPLPASSHCAECQQPIWQLDYLCHECRQ